MGMCHGSVRSVEQELRGIYTASSRCEKTATKMTAPSEDHRALDGHFEGQKDLGY
jgi:hypothetical protein